MIKYITDIVTELATKYKIGIDEIEFSYTAEGIYVDIPVDKFEGKSYDNLFWSVLIGSNSFIYPKEIEFQIRKSLKSFIYQQKKKDGSGIGSS